MTHGAVPAIERTVDLAADAGRAWSAITDPVELAGWLGTGSMAPMVEGLAVLEPGRRVRWAWAVGGGPASRVELALTGRPGGGTRLLVRESGFGTAEERAERSVGWTRQLGELLARLAVQPWEAGLRRTWHLRADPARVWAAIGEPSQLAAWWGGGEVRIVPGASGWWDWPGLGRYAVTFDAVEPPDHLAWRWTTEPGVTIDEAPEVLRTWFTLAPRPDGGTDLLLLEHGFRGPTAYRENAGGWDGDVVPGLLDLLGEGGGPG